VCLDACRDQHFRGEGKERATEIEKFTDLVSAVVRLKMQAGNGRESEESATGLETLEKMGQVTIPEVDAEDYFIYVDASGII
jgi:hypothetical protein